MPRSKVDYRAARAVLAAPYPLPVIITRSRAAASAPPPSSIHDNQSDEPHDSVTGPGELLDIIPEDPKTPTTGGLAAQHGFPYNKNWKEMPPAFPPIPYPPKQQSGSQSHSQSQSQSSTDKSVLRLQRSKKDLKGKGKAGQMAVDGREGVQVEEAEMMSGIEEGPTGEKDVLREISGLNGLDNTDEAVGTSGGLNAIQGQASHNPPGKSDVPPIFPGLLGSAFETNLSSSFLSKTPSPPGVESAPNPRPSTGLDKGKAPLRSVPLPEDSTSREVTPKAASVAPPPLSVGSQSQHRPSQPSHTLTQDQELVPREPTGLALGRAWSPSSVSSNVRSWSADLEDGDEREGEGDQGEEESNADNTPDSHRLITPANARVPTPRSGPIKFFGETNLAPFTYDAGEESEGTSVITITRIPRSKYKRSRPSKTSVRRQAQGQRQGPAPGPAGHQRIIPRGSSVALGAVTHLDFDPTLGRTNPSNALKRRRDGSKTPTRTLNRTGSNRSGTGTGTGTGTVNQTQGQGSSKQAFLGDRSPTPTQARYGSQGQAQAQAPNRARAAHLGELDDSSNQTPTQRFFNLSGSGEAELVGGGSGSGQRFDDVPPSLPSPVPMSIDPRSADFRNASWPRALNQFPQYDPPSEGFLQAQQQRQQMGNTYPGAYPYPFSIPQQQQQPQHQFPNDLALTSYNTQGQFGGMRVDAVARQQQARDDLRLPSAPPDRPGSLPIAKACHNFLLQRKVQAAKRRRLVSEYNRRTFEQAQREGKVLVTSSRHFVDSLRHDEQNPIHRLAYGFPVHDDEGGGGDGDLEPIRAGRRSQKRRREHSSPSWEDDAVGHRMRQIGHPGPVTPHQHQSHLLPPASIFDDDEMDEEGMYDDMMYDDEPMFDMELDDSAAAANAATAMPFNQWGVVAGPSNFATTSNNNPFNNRGPQRRSPTRSPGQNQQVHFTSPPPTYQRPAPYPSMASTARSPPRLTGVSTSAAQLGIGRNSRSPTAGAGAGAGVGTGTARQMTIMQPLNEDTEELEEIGGGGRGGPRAAGVGGGGGGGGGMSGAHGDVDDDGAGERNELSAFNLMIAQATAQRQRGLTGGPNHKDLRRAEWIKENRERLASLHRNKSRGASAGRGGRDVSMGMGVGMGMGMGLGRGMEGAGGRERSVVVAPGGGGRRGTRDVSMGVGLEHHRERSRGVSRARH